MSKTLRELIEKGLSKNRNRIILRKNLFEGIDLKEYEIDQNTYLFKKAGAGGAVLKAVNKQGIFSIVSHIGRQAGRYFISLSNENKLYIFDCIEDQPGSEALDFLKTFNENIWNNVKVCLSVFDVSLYVLNYYHILKYLDRNFSIRRNTVFSIWDYLKLLKKSVPVDYKMEFRDYTEIKNYIEDISMYEQQVRRLLNRRSSMEVMEFYEVIGKKLNYLYGNLDLIFHIVDNFSKR